MMACPIPPDAKVLFAKDMLPGELYQTAQTSDPKKQYPARLLEVKPESVLIEAYFPDLRSWNRIEVQKEYRVVVYPKEASMSRNKTNKVENLSKKPVRDESYGRQAPQATGLKTGRTVYEVWGKAFAQFGTHGDAPEKIVKHMETEFPGRKTLWKKWVNAVRARFNSGKLPGVKKPLNPVPVYRCAFLENERRDVPLRRETVGRRAKEDANAKAKQTSAGK